LVSSMVFPLSSIKDFKITIGDEHELFRKTVRKFVEEDLEPIADKIEKNNEIPMEVLHKAKELGFMGIGIPEEYGGQGGDNIMMAIMTEELARVSPAFAIAVAINYVFTIPVLLFGTEEQKRKYITPIASGKSFGAHANTEPVAGSDVAGIQSEAKSYRDIYVLTGRKTLITGADKADFFLVSARTNPPGEKRWWGITLFIIEKGFEGFKIGQRINTMGMRGEQPYELILDDVKVPKNNVLGDQDEGFKYLLTTYDHTRIAVAAQAVGIAQGAFEKALKYSRERHAFGRPIIKFQGVSFKISDILMELEAARLLTYWAATLADAKNQNYIIASSLAKAYATEAAEKAALLSIKVHGGYGVDSEVGVEKYLRDAVITTIYEGTNDIQRLTIARILEKRT